MKRSGEYMDLGQNAANYFFFVILCVLLYDKSMNTKSHDRELVVFFFDVFFLSEERQWFTV